jgi:DNA polymerase III alpha subunit
VIWAQIESFAAYSYCKAHATTYGHISYQAAWLKAHYPAEFLAAVIANKAGFYDPQTYYRDARRFNVPVLPPDVNGSDVECRAERGAVRPGLDIVRDLSVRTMRRILQQRLRRPFASLEDFAARVRLTRQELENLILCGAFDWTGRTRPTLMMAADLLERSARPAPDHQDAAEAVQAGLFRGAPPETPPPPPLIEVPAQPPFPLSERVRWEMGLLGMTHSGHPLDAWDGTLDARGTVASFELPDLVGRRVAFIGWLVMMRHALTRKREYMKFLCLEDRHGVVEAVIFPDVYRRWGHQTEGGGAYRVEGTVEEQHGAVNLVCEKVERLPDP